MILNLKKFLVDKQRPQLKKRYFYSNTIGNSKNILEALKISNKRKVNCYAILGGTGGKAKKLSQNKLIIKSNSPSRVQEIHIIFWQNVCELVENKFRKKKKIV